MPSCDKMPILDVLERIVPFSPVKIVFNDQFTLYNDYDKDCEETEPFDKVVPERLKTALENKDVFVTKFEVLIVHSHHSLIYLYGEINRKNS